MSISNLMLAILAMDSYNRTYNEGIIIPGSQIGTAMLRTVELPQGYRAASFFAQAYTWNGQTVISYRGTDQPTAGNGLGGDIWNGYGLATGSPHSAQSVAN